MKYNIFKYFLIWFACTSVSTYSQITPLIVPTGPGGLYHKYAFEFSPSLSTILKKNIVIEFHPGAQGLVGAQVLADNKKSDISLMLSAAQPEFSINQQKDIIPLLYLGVAPTVLVSSNTLEVRSVKDLINTTKKLNIGIVNGSSQLFWIRQLVQQNPNLDINEIPYKSGNGLIIDVANGNLDLGIVSVVGAEPLIQDNRVRALAVLSNRRSTLLPSVPTTIEQGARFDTGFAHLFVWASPGITSDKILEIQKQFKQWTQTKEAQSIIEKLDLGFDPEHSTQPMTVMTKILKNR